MKIIRKPLQMQALAKKIKLNKKTIGLVPTMGALHDGHLSLIRCCRKDNDITVVSIFVNPAQFGPGEDLKKYPRPLAKDLSLCRKEGVDLVFYPDKNSIYPAGFKTYVYVEGLSSLLCGRSRPGHFQGVTTIVAKLFNIVDPDNAYFGQKDAQQAVIIRRMAEGLNFPVKVRVMPIVREKDGLAMSSRNIYLNARQRKEALVLSESLNLAKKIADSGTRDTAKIVSAMRKLVAVSKQVKIDYLSIVDMNNLRSVKRISGPCLAVLAAWVGKTRLIDNTILN